MKAGGECRCGNMAFRYETVVYFTANETRPKGQFKRLICLACEAIYLETADGKGWRYHADPAKQISPPL